MTSNISPRDLESLSAYLDGQLSDKERFRLEKELQANASFRAILEDLRRTRALLRSQPRIRAPRNFTLTSAIVGARARPRPSLNLFPALRLTSALASFVFVLVVLGELVLGGRPVAAPMIAAQAPAPASVEAQREELAVPVEESEAAEQAAPAAKMAPEQEVQSEAQGTEAVVVMEATQEAPPDFPIDVPPETFSEDSVVRPRGEGGGGGAPGIGGGEGSVEEIPLEETVEGTPQPEEALALSMVITPTATLEAQVEIPLVLAEAPGEAEQVVAGEEVEAPTPGRWSAWRWLQVALAFVALVAGGLAIYLRRTGRA